MTFTAFKRFKRLLASAGIAALMTAFGVSASPAYANTRTPGALSNHNHYPENQDVPVAEERQDVPQAEDIPAAFRPGQWRRVTENRMGDPTALSLEAVVLAEKNASAAAGRPVVFYKVIVTEGPGAGVYTNLIDSQWRGENVNRMYMFSRGLLAPVRNVEDLGDYGYRNIRATDYDRSLARFVADAHPVVVARANTRPDIQLASADVVPTPRPRPRPVVVAAANPLPREVPIPQPRPADLNPPAQVEVAAAAPVVQVIRTDAPIVLAEAVIPPSAIVVTPLPPLEAQVPVRRVRTQRITPPVPQQRPARQEAEVRLAAADRAAEAVARTQQPAVTRVAAAAPVAAQPAIEHVAPAAVPVPERAVLVAANEQPAARPAFAAVASPIQRAMEARRLARQASVGPMPDNDNDDRSKDRFNMAALNNASEPRLVEGGAPTRGWVTPAGRKMEFHVYRNGRFKLAPQLMAA